MAIKMKQEAINTERTMFIYILHSIKIPYNHKSEN